jgi:site-specific DNA-cytosine methylase
LGWLGFEVAMEPLKIVDLFCGAGGSTEGILKAVKQIGRQEKIFAINLRSVAR